MISTLYEYWHKTILYMFFNEEIQRFKQPIALLLIEDSEIYKHHLEINQLNSRTLESRYDYIHLASRPVVKENRNRLLATASLLCNARKAGEWTCQRRVVAFATK